MTTTMRSVLKSIMVLETLSVVAVRAFTAVPSRSVPAKSPVLRERRLLASSSPSSSPSFRVNNNFDESPARELRFDMIELIRNDEDAGRQSRKLESLASVVRACSRLRNDDDGVVKRTDEDDIALPEHLAPFRRFIRTSSRAEDHQGCFGIFTENDAAAPTPSSLTSLPSNAILSQESPFAFLRDSLSCRSDGSTVRKRGGMMYDSSEAVVWCSVNDRRDELEFASRVLDGMPLAQLRLGSGLGNTKRKDRTVGGLDEGDNHLVVELALKTVKVLDSMGVLLYNVVGKDDCEDSIADGDKVCCKLNPDDLAIIETILCCDETRRENTCDQSTLREWHQSTIVKMIDVAVESVRKDPLNKNDEPHLVLISHSVSTSVVASAISSWKHRQTRQRGEPIRWVEDMLHQALTVVTMGNVCRSFCDGPAYVHVSMHDDPWTTALGSFGGEDSPGGRDAVHLRACSPYDHVGASREDRRPRVATTGGGYSSLECHNAHNLNACIVQYMCLIMRINGLRSFRALYDAARFVDPVSILDIDPRHFAVHCDHGDLVVPPHVDDELLPAMIRATGGDRWMWTVDGDRDDEVESLLPDEIETRSHLEESFGYGVLEEIRATCCG